jgi:DNA polymerase
MPDIYSELLGATIHHLEELKARGTKFVPVSDEVLVALNRPATRRPLPKENFKPQTPSFSPESFRGSIAKPQPAQSSPPLQAKTAEPGGPAAGIQEIASNLVTKEAAFADLRRRALTCVKCSHLASSRKNVVFGVGNINAELMFVGEAPGADEDIQAEPFVGRAGQLLTKIIETMGLKRESVYIANILKCRPDTPGQAYGNRKPTPEEMQTCIPFLHEQIDLIKPKVLVALGGTAVEGLLHTSGINKLRGNWQVYRGTPLMPTFHPAYLLRTPGDKRKAWEDMLKVMEKLGLPISEKQRGFFLKSA